MNSREAIKAAKNYIADVYSGENIADIGLEEVGFDDAGGVWEITIGFVRPSNSSNPLALALANARRTYKVVRLKDDDGEVLSMKNRDVESVD